MTNKRYFLLAGLVAFIGLVGISCSIYGENNPIATLTPVSVTQLPTNIPTQTVIPTIHLGPTSLPSPTAMPPSYPTASVVSQMLWRLLQTILCGLRMWMAAEKEN